MRGAATLEAKKKTADDKAEKAAEAFEKAKKEAAGLEKTNDGAQVDADANKRLFTGSCDKGTVAPLRQARAPCRMFVNQPGPGAYRSPYVRARALSVPVAERGKHKRASRSDIISGTGVKDDGAGNPGTAHVSRTQQTDLPDGLQPIPPAPCKGCHK